MKKLHKLLMTTAITTSILGGNIYSTPAQNTPDLLTITGKTIFMAQSRLPNSRTCENHRSFKRAYSRGWSAGFNQQSTHNNTYQDAARRHCYQWGYTNGLSAKSKLDLQKIQSDSASYRICLSNRLLDPNIQCQRPNY